MFKAGRSDLAAEALGGVSFTDDGSTLYVHVFARPDWVKVAPGRAFVLAWGDYDVRPALALRRALIEEARLSLRDNIESIARWLDGI